MLNDSKPHMNEPIRLTPEVIDLYKDFLVNPGKHNLSYRPITECFEKSSTVTAKHILAKQYMDYLNRPLPKVVLYIIMDQVFGQCDGLDPVTKFGDHPNAPGCLGYHLRFVHPVTIYHTPIQVETICKNGSERSGANASCKFGTDPKGKLFEITKYGKTKQAAINELTNILKRGVDRIEEIKPNE
jgi:hypothetical protein